MEKKRYYLAYGSNLKKAQMKERCSEARFVGTTEVPDYELLFKQSKTGYYLTIEPAKGKLVPVAVWETTDKDEKCLDVYEGFPEQYGKSEMKVSVQRSDNGLTETLTVYVYTLPKEREIGSPTAEYIERCRQGYRDFGFSEKYLDEAIEKSGGM